MRSLRLQCTVNLGLLVFMLMAFPLASFAQSSVTGHWQGSFDITKPDGTVVNDVALLYLQQTGAVLTGTAGPDEQKRSEITAGNVNGNEVTFSVEIVKGAPLVFDLHLVGEHLKGEAHGELPNTGAVKIAVDVTRLESQSENAPAKTDLYGQISHLDTVLFDAFNARDLATLKSLFADDLEFFHDRQGLTNYAKNMEMFQQNFAGETRVRRALIAGSLEVYPIPGYGAVEVGVHQFYSTEKGQPERLTATAKFMHVWQNRDGHWKISRVVSYDHR